MRGHLIRIRWEVEEIIDMISKKYGISKKEKARMRNYLILLGIYQFLKTGNDMIKPDMSYKEIRKLEEEIRKELEQKNKPSKVDVEGS